MDINVGIMIRAANDPSVLTITKKAWLKVHTSTFTLKTGGLVIILSYSRPSLMIIASGTQFHVERPLGQYPFSIVS